MRNTITPQDLEQHRLWNLTGGKEGKRLERYGANLSGANLSRANLSRANLSGANLSRADLSGANLYGADLSRANLSGANLSRANLYGADLSRANLYGADLSGADLSGANLSGAGLSRANLSGANLSRADLSGANLYGADLSRANLSRANLYGADLSRANLSGAGLSDEQIKLLAFQIPQEGPLWVWKKVAGGVIQLCIPDGAKRTASIVGRKCRAEYAVILNTNGVADLQSLHDSSFVYPDTVGATVRPASYNPDPRIECAPGIHFYLTREEAERN